MRSRLDRRGHGRRAVIVNRLRVPIDRRREFLDRACMMLQGNACAAAAAAAVGAAGATAAGAGIAAACVNATDGWAGADELLLLDATVALAAPLWPPINCSSVERRVCTALIAVCISLIIQRPASAPIAKPPIATIT